MCVCVEVRTRKLFMREDETEKESQLEPGRGTDEKFNGSLGYIQLDQFI